MGFLTSRAVFGAALYGVSSAVWIVGSDRLSAWWFPDAGDLAAVESLKGVAFVLASSVGVLAALWTAERGRARSARRWAEDLADEAERRAAADLAVSGVAHDLRNVLTALRCGLDDLAQGPGLDLAEREAIDDLHRAVSAGAGLVDALRRGGDGGGPKQRIDLRHAVGAVVDSLRAHPDVARADVEVAGTSAVCRVEPCGFARIVGNLVVNAAQAATSRVRVTVRGAGGGAVLEVHDDGPGVAAAVRERLFEPYVTTKEGGTGLGLYTARRCVIEHGGRIDVERSALGGACFRVTFPPPAA